MYFMFLNQHRDTKQGPSRPDPNKTKPLRLHKYRRSIQQRTQNPCHQWNTKRNRRKIPTHMGHDRNLGDSHLTSRAPALHLVGLTKPTIPWEKEGSRWHRLLGPQRNHQPNPNHTHIKIFQRPQRHLMALNIQPRGQHQHSPGL